MPERRAYVVANGVSLPWSSLTVKEGGMNNCLSKTLFHLKMWTFSVLGFLTVMVMMYGLPGLVMDPVSWAFESERNKPNAMQTRQQIEANIFSDPSA